MSLTSEKKEFFLAEKTKECESQSQTIKELQEQLKEKGDAVDQLSHEKESLRKSIDEKEKRIQELQAQMQDVDLSKMKEEKESLLKDVSTSNALIADLNKKNEEPQSRDREAVSPRQGAGILSFSDRAAGPFSVRRVGFSEPAFASP